MKINQRGFWENENAEGHSFDSALCVRLIKLFGCYSVLDLGCGTGEYLAEFKKLNPDCYGLDGNPHTPILTKGFCQTYDLSVPLYLDSLYDVVLSLEVGEHIPSEFEDVFLDNISRHAGQVAVISWAIPGQGGDGHVNEHANEYIIHKMETRNFYYEPEFSRWLRDSATFPWFKRSIMVFFLRGKSAIR